MAIETYGRARLPGSTTTRTAAILEAVRAALMDAHRRDMFDQADDLVSVMLIVKLHAGTAVVKSVACSDERVQRRLPQRTVASA